MIVYVDIEHERVKEMPDRWNQHLQWQLDAKYRLEEISGDHCLIMRYEQCSPEALRNVNARAVLVSGNTTEFQHYDEASLAGLRSVFREVAQPTLSFCGGFQMMAETFGSRAAAIVEDEPGHMYDDSWKERTCETGFLPVQRTDYHPLMADMDDEMTFLEAHYWEIKSVPDGFRVHASTETTPIQLIAHESLPLFGTQFHPEAYDDQHQDGKHFLKNFFALVTEFERTGTLMQTA